MLLFSWGIIRIYPGRGSNKFDRRYSLKTSMPVKLNGMPRIIYKGVPVWKSSNGDLFLYDPNSTDTILIGSESNGFLPNVAEICSQRIQDYRTSLVERHRMQKK
jgi:hypothetical protein